MTEEAWAMPLSTIRTTSQPFRFKVDLIVPWVANARPPRGVLPGSGCHPVNPWSVQ